MPEWKSRYHIALLLPDIKEEHVTPTIIKALKEFPDELVKTITFDREKEFAGYEKIEKELNCNIYIFVIHIVCGRKEQMKIQMDCLESFIPKVWIYQK